MNCRMITPAKMSLIFLIVALLLCGFGLYKMFFEKEIRCNKLVNEISQMKVTSCKIDTITWLNEINYEIMVGNKYCIFVEHELQIPFENEGSYEIYIKNVDGKVLFIHCTRWQASNWAWDSDAEKLIKYLKL